MKHCNYVNAQSQRKKLTECHVNFCYKLKSSLQTGDTGWYRPRVPNFRILVVAKREERWPPIFNILQQGGDRRGCWCIHAFLLCFAGNIPLAHGFIGTTGTSFVNNLRRQEEIVAVHRFQILLVRKERLNVTTRQTVVVLGFRGAVGRNAADLGLFRDHGGVLLLLLLLLRFDRGNGVCSDFGLVLFYENKNSHSRQFLLSFLFFAGLTTRTLDGRIMHFHERHTLSSLLVDHRRVPFPSGSARCRIALSLV